MKVSKVIFERTAFILAEIIPIEPRTGNAV